MQPIYLEADIYILRGNITFVIAPDESDYMGLWKISYPFFIFEIDDLFAISYLSVRHYHSYIDKLSRGLTFMKQNLI